MMIKRGRLSCARESVCNCQRLLKVMFFAAWTLFPEMTSFWKLPDNHQLEKEIQD